MLTKGDRFSVLVSTVGGVGLVAAACGGKVTFDPGGGSATVSSGSGGAPGSTTGAGAGGTGGVAGSPTSTTGSGGQGWQGCDVHCNLVSACAIDYPDCLKACEWMEADVLCTDEFIEWGTCLNDGLATGCDGSSCGPTGWAYTDCTYDCSNDLLELVQSVSCENQATCSGLLFEVDCVLNPVIAAECTCSVNGTVVGACKDTSQQDACKIDDGCCAGYFGF